MTVPHWRRNFPQNVGIPTRPKPYKCSACVVPIWIWDGKIWLCYNCKLSSIIHDREMLDETTLEGCLPSGVYPRQREDDELV